MAMSDIKFDIIFMDLHLPIGMDCCINVDLRIEAQVNVVPGETISRLLKFTTSLNQTTFIVALAAAYETTYEQAQEFDDVLFKPITQESLNHVLSAMSRPDPLTPRGVTF